jgi:hypothetical protein
MHTFDDDSHLVRVGFVRNQWVERHGCATNVVKTGGNVVKSVVNPDDSPGRVGRGFAARWGGF